MIRTFVDATVLIAAATGRDPHSELAVQLLKSEDRLFVASRFLLLEVLPKAVYYGRVPEVAVYAKYFDVVSAWADDVETVLEGALKESQRVGLSALDALHIAAAAAAGADELVTLEKPGKPIYRTRLVRVVHLSKG